MMSTSYSYITQIGHNSLIGRSSLIGSMSA